MTSALPKNLNLPWVAATSLAVWFLFIHTPKFWVQRKLLTRDTLLAIHIVAAGTLYLACAHNCMFTPSCTFPWGKRRMLARLVHEWVGRIGFVAGVISFVLGAFLSWWRLGKVGEGGTKLGFALPISIGGILQLAAQYNGFISIRKYKRLTQEIAELAQDQDQNDCTSKELQGRQAQELENLKVEQRKALRLHIGHMVTLFVNACGIPAGIRLVELASGGREGLMITVAIFAAIGILNMLANYYMRIMKPKHLEKAR